MPLHHVLELELGPGRRLAREDSAVVRANLLQCGFHLQAPPPRFAEFGASIRHD
jgi:uncharacterized protein YcgL (UPF0745 family)